MIDIDLPIMISDMRLRRARSWRRTNGQAMIGSGSFTIHCAGRKACGNRRGTAAPAVHRPRRPVRGNSYGRCRPASDVEVGMDDELTVDLDELGRATPRLGALAARVAD